MTTGQALALTESPTQLLNATEWWWRHRDEADLHAVILAPRAERTRLQLRSVIEELPDQIRVTWAEVRGPNRAIILPRVLRHLRRSDTLVIGDPFSGIIQFLVGQFPVHHDLVVVDDGTATLRYMEVVASGGELVRWHQRDKPGAVRRTLAARALSRLREADVTLFTALQLDGSGIEPNDYAWVRETYPEPTILPGVDLLGTSLVETGVIDEDKFLIGLAKLVRERDVRRYFPHRKESTAKLARIARLGVEVVHKALPIEIWARRDPVAGTLLTFPSTVVHTLPLVLTGSGVDIEIQQVPDAWYVAGTDESAKDFVRRSAEPGSA